VRLSTASRVSRLLPAILIHNGILDPGVSLLPKPFTLEQLAHMLREVLSGTT
jgi:hypothetical protein